jgi:hypothetical protein
VLVVRLSPWQLLVVWVVVLVQKVGLVRVAELVHLAQVVMALKAVLVGHPIYQPHAAAAPSLCPSFLAVSLQRLHGKSEAASQKLSQLGHPPQELPVELAMPLVAKLPL